MKIVFFDIDGTLINAQEGMMQPRHQTKQVLKDFQKQGNKIVIASARGAIPEGLKDIPFDGYVLCDGHYIIYNNEILVDEVLTTPEIQKQMEVYQKYQGRPMFYGHHGEWCDCLDDELVVKHRVMFQGTDQRPENVVERYEAQDVDAISCCVLFETVEQMWKAYHELENDIEARKFALPVLLEAPADLKYLTGNDTILKEDAISDFKDYDNEYVSSYLELPYNKRKVLLPVNSYTDLCQDYLSVIDIKKLPDSGIVFPIGHPVAYQLYVGHPYIKQKYLPFESYELELIEDKVREFCQLVQCLGATEISIECLNSSSSDRNTNAEQHISVEASYRVATASGKNDRSQTKHLIDEISQSINLHQKFVPNGKPHLPEGLVWYPNEPSWQRLYNQRMQGALQQHEERIETRKNRVLEGSELNSIEGEFKSLFLAANGQWSKKIEEKFELQENAVLAIHVQFASLQELEQQGTTVSASSISQYTEDEKEYLEELKNCLEESGEISSGERRLLEKLRKHLGISEERALALEESLKPSLTEDEKEYLEEYKLCLEEGGSISASERRLLDKLRNRLGISEERAKEIEKMK